MTTFEEMPSVQTAVELEARRRKRVFAVFLSLLLIPLAIGLYAIVKAPSETEAVARNVAPLIESNVERNVEKNVEARINARVDQQIEPRVEAIVARRATPVIQRELARQVDAVVTARVQPLEQRVRLFAVEGNPEQQRMAVRVKELEARVAALEQRLAAISDARIPVNPDKERPVLTHVPKRPGR